MYILKLNEAQDINTEESLKIFNHQKKLLKKKNIPERLKILLKILDSCVLLSKTGELTIAGLILSSFKNEMKSINKALMDIDYSPKNDKNILMYACYVYRTKKYNYGK